MGHKLDRASRERLEKFAAAGNQWWDYATSMALYLMEGGRPPVSEIHGVVLEADERLHLSTSTGYSRYYAPGDGSWTAASVVAVGNPYFIAGALAGNAIGNARRASAAREASKLRWREQQQTGVLVTDRRVLCFSGGRGTWLSFWFSGVTEFYPDLDSWSVTMAFASGDPLRLSGPEAPALALWCARGILGERWIGDPRLSRLLPRLRPGQTGHPTA